MRQEQVIFTHNCFQILGITVLYYDHYLTFPKEVLYMWRSPSRATAGTFWFLLNRYLNFFGDIAVAIFIFKDLDAVGCKHWNLFRQILLVASQVVVSIIMTYRTYALYNRDRRVLALILAIAFSLFGIACWGLLGQHSSIPPVDGCHVALSRITAIRVAIAWEALFALDTLIFFLTLRRTHALARRGGRGLAALMLRDGALYFGVMALANLANLVTFYVAEPMLRGTLSTFASAVSVSMASRMFLNLHQRAIVHEKTAPTEGSAPEFTTRFGLETHGLPMESTRKGSQDDPVFGRTLASVGESGESGSGESGGGESGIWLEDADGWRRAR